MRYVIRVDLFWGYLLNVFLGQMDNCVLIMDYMAIIWQLLFVGCLTSQQTCCVSQGWICSDKFTCCHTEVEAADPTFYLNQLQYTDTGPTSPSIDPRMPGAWQGSYRSANA